MSNDSGAVTLFLAIASLGLFALLGLAVDGGAKVRAVQRADRLAAEAARAAGQAVDLTSVMAGKGIRVDRQDAVDEAMRFLASARVQGAVTVSDGGQSVRVEVETQQPTVFLGLIGIHHFSASGHAEAVLVHG